MTSFYLKLLAIITMTIDHIGKGFFQGSEIFFITGRLAFPLFAFLVAEGAHHTKNRTQYLIRLFLFACIAQLPFLLNSRLNDATFWGTNVLFTLSLGLLAIILWEKFANKILQLLCLLLCVIAAYFLQTDYAGLGVLSVFSFYVFKNQPSKLLTSQVLLFTGVCISSLIRDMDKVPGLQVNAWYYIPFAIFSLLFISIYNGKEGTKLKYFFYAYYPLHLLGIYLIRTYF